jgi:repressor LexA
MEKMSEKQKNIYRYIVDYINENSYPPSVREIGQAAGLSSTSTVHGYLQRLEKRGLIKRGESKSRAISVIDGTSPSVDLNSIERFDTSNLVSIPVIGNVTAGMPILAHENIEEYLTLPRSIATHEESFILNVKGESMINAGILDGDRIIVRKQNRAQNGEIVVALIEDEATVKTYYVDDDHIRLQPENPVYEPILAREVNILGKVIGVFRIL